MVFYVLLFTWQSQVIEHLQTPCHVVVNNLEKYFHVPFRAELFRLCNRPQSHRVNRVIQAMKYLKVFLWFFAEHKIGEKFLQTLFKMAHLQEFVLLKVIRLLLFRLDHMNLLWSRETAIVLTKNIHKLFPVFVEVFVAKA
jgi:hypothetical protein